MKDSLGVENALRLFPDQILECWKQAYSFDIPQFSPKAVVISGMGGSSNAAKILEGLYEEDFKVPFDIDIHNDYELPIWVKEDTLVVANSYSGNTEETLSSVEAAQKVSAKIIGVTTGGKLKEMIQAKQIDGVFVDDSRVNPSHLPKVGLGVSFGALAGTLAKMGVLKLNEKELQDALDELNEVRKMWLPEIEETDNPAKQIAKWLYGYVPVLFGGRPLLGSLNAGRNVMCEVSRVFTLFFDFPEVNHVLVEATQKPDIVKEKFKYLFFISNFNHPRVLIRYKVTAEILTKQGLAFKDYQLKGSSKLTQALELPHFCAWVAFYLSVLAGTDPGPEPWIVELKNKLSQPVH
jgi:glucose/mannose-6-phosphate isomerase